MSIFRSKNSRFRRGPIAFRYILLMSFILFVILLTQGLWIVNNNIQPTLIKYGEVETHKMATAIMTKAVKDRINEGFDVDSLMKVQNDKNGKVSTINLNTKQVNEIVTSTTTYIEKYLQQVEQGKLKELGIAEKNGATMAVPFGRVTDNALLGNIGPDIPIHFAPVGHVNTDIKQKIEPHGINTTAIQIVMEMEVTLQVIIPFHTKEIKVKQNVPIATRIVQGEVPTYYGSGSVAVPDKKKTDS
ncbi:sporulation protein YunB [Bacillus cereus group sp. MYBK120-1]|uniref:sporulation protein YunB n=1 Tax=Bacillus cereus group TaxID=86661 RepID=UPI00234E1D5A|nr:sporulation protein YunB [Bacillus cereus]MDC7729066.1 sporulation protein YunB [Bacillus cereus]